MNLSKERLNEIALDVWLDISIRGNQDSNQNLKDFALAIIRRVEAESQKVKPGGFFNGGSKYLRLPLVSEE